MGITPNNE